MEFVSSLQGGHDDRKPSLFEVLSEQQLGALIPPSLRYLLALATHRHPRYLLRVLNSFDELYALLMLAVERHYLRVYGGGFTENFYGLKRERVLQIPGGEVPRAQLGAAGLVRETLKLSESDVWKNLAVMVGLPYIKRKLDESYDIHNPQATLLGPTYNRDALPPDATLRQTVVYIYKWFLRKVYPSINAAYHFSQLAFNLAYLFDSSKYHSPFLYLVGTRMRRLGEADYRAIATATSPPSPPTSTKPAGHRPGQTTSLFHPSILTQTITPRLLSSLRILLPTSIFALKFLEWWHASDFARQLSRKASEGLELPPPTSGAPPPPSSQKRRRRKPPISASTRLPIFTLPAPSPQTSHLCPICAAPVANATAAPSGFVFCYACIHRWVAGEHDLQTRFMAGDDDSGVWAEEEEAEQRGKSREGRWESGIGRCAVSGRRVLGGTEGLRRVVV